MALSWARGGERKGAGEEGGGERKGRGEVEGGERRE